MDLCESTRIFLEVHKNRIKATSPHLNDYIEKNFISFKHHYDAVKEASALEMSEHTKNLLISLSKAVRFVFNEDINRFELMLTDSRISHVQLTPQLSYVIIYIKYLIQNFH